MTGTEARERARTPAEKLAAVREWVESGIGATLGEDPSGFLLGIESASILEALDDVARAVAEAATLRQALEALLAEAADGALLTAEDIRAALAAGEASR